MNRNLSIQFGNTELYLTGDGMIWMEQQRALIASDIHFEKSSFYSRFLTFLPPYDSNETLEKLEEAISYYKPDIFIALGDSFHDRIAAERMDQNIVERLNNLIQTVPEWRWITGNHDPEISDIIAGQRSYETKIGEIIFRHELDPEQNDFEISGHFHPKTSVNVKGNVISGPCFVQTERKLIMPAFGSFTGGLNIQSSDFTSIISKHNRRAYLLHNKKIYAV